VHGAAQVCNGRRYPQILVRLDKEEVLTWINRIAFTKGENQCLEYETKIAKLEEDYEMEIAELKEKIAKLEKASTANQNLQSNDFTCPTERSNSTAVFKKVNGKCYFYTHKGCKADGDRGCTFQQAQDQCKTAFGAGIFGKVFEPTSIEDNDAVLKAAKDALDGSWIFWIGVSNKPLRYKSNNNPVSISTIPWKSGQPSKTASETQCLYASPNSLKWYADRPCSHQYGTICETSFN